MQAHQATEFTGQQHASSGCVLLADPDVVTATPIKHELGAFDYVVVTAKSSTEALEIVSKKKIEMALL